MTLHIVHTEASQGWGGQEVRILTEAKSLQNLGHRITLLTPPTAKIYTAASNYGLEVVAMPYEKKSIKAIKSTRRWFKNNQPDIVNTHSSIDSWVSAIARIGLDLPIVRTRHISAPISKNFSSRWLYTKGADHIVTTGMSLRTDIIKRLGINGSKITSIPTGIDLQRFSLQSTKSKHAMRKSLGISQDALVIGIAATLRSWKGHDYLLDAFSQISKKHPNTSLLIAGDGPRREVISNWVKASGLAARIHLIGHRDDMPDVLAAMDIFALPSFANEGVPQAILQAMAMQLPVVSTNVGAIEEAVINKKTGLVVMPKDAQALTEALEAMIDDTGMRNTFSINAREWVEQNFSIEYMAQRMLTIFQRLA